jgi:hypothetical protein
MISRQKNPARGLSENNPAFPHSLQNLVLGRDNLIFPSVTCNPYSYVKIGQFLDVQGLQALGGESAVSPPKTRFWSECENWGMPA